MTKTSKEIEKYFKVTDKKICGFFKEYRFLSNFQTCNIQFNGFTYSSTEAAFQAAKSLDPKDHERFQFLSAAESKKEGRLLNLREDWEKVKDDIMLTLTFEKFKDPELAEKLLATGDLILEETNHWHDIYWGVDYETNQGLNMLGKCLMVVRGVLKGRLEQQS